MKLDKVRLPSLTSKQLLRPVLIGFQDNSGTIERDEFLSLPQVSSNPLATRYLSPFERRRPILFPGVMANEAVFLSV